MAARRSGGTRSETIRCPYCGEDYASSYKHCPFCDELPEDEDYGYEDDGAPRARGGKRLMTNTKGGGYGGGPSVGKIAGTIISLIIIVAAVIIVVTQIVPLLRDSNEPPASPPPSSTVQPSETPAVSPTPEQPDDTTPPVEETTPPVSNEDTATSFTLDEAEFTISNRYPEPITLKVTFAPAGSTGTITWTSSNPDAVQVNGQGVVSAGTRQGSATITATLANGFSQTCLVHNTTTGSSSGGGNTGNGGSSTLSLNREDFTMEPGETFQMKVSGTTSTPVWSIGNTAVATVSGSGIVTHVGAGRTTLTCTVDGQTLTCIVRCN